MTETYSDVDEIRAALAEELRGAVEEARGRIAAVVDPTCPTPAFMTALADELARAAADPSAVPYPELADADRYWSAAIQPQMQAAHDQIVAILAWLEQQIFETMVVAEADLKREVDLALGAVSANPLADRSHLDETLQRRCSDLHHQMAELLGALPDSALLTEAQTRFHQALHEQAVADVDGLKPRSAACPSCSCSASKTRSTRERLTQRPRVRGVSTRCRNTR